MNYIRVIILYLISIALIFILLPIALSNYAGGWGAVTGGLYIIGAIIISNICISIYGYLKTKSVWKIILMLYIMNMFVYFSPDILAHIISTKKLFSVAFLEQCVECIVYDAILSLICLIPISLVKLICIILEKKGLFKK